MSKLFVSSVFGILIFSITGMRSHAQVFKSISIIDSTKVQLYAQKSESGSNEYYCIPASLRLSETTEGDKEFLLLAYKREGSQDWEVILHFLLTFGYTPKQLSHIDSIITERDSLAIFKGEILLEPIANLECGNKNGDQTLFEMFILGNTNQFDRPLNQFSKMAFAYRFSGKMANAMLECVSNPEKLKGICITSSYQRIASISDNDGIPKTPITMSLELSELILQAKQCKSCIQITE